MRFAYPRSRNSLAGVRILRRLGDPVVLARRPVVPVLRLLGLVLVLVVLLARDANGREHGRLVELGRWRIAVLQPVGEQRGECAGQRVDLMGGEHCPVDQLRLVLGEQPVQPEQQRPLAPPVR
jgi:hypothetical protein